MKKISILIAKTIKKLSQLSGKGGSNLPGEFARRIDKNILSKLRKEVDTVIFITGTNGKTTTSTLLGHILKQNHSIVWNKEGSNLITGITTAFIDQQPIFGKRKIDYAVIEIDEGSLPQVLKEITPDYMLGLNLFPDQIDRYGSPAELSQRLRKSLEHQDIQFILNANDPYIVNLGIEEKARYFALDKILSQEVYHQETIECINCQEPLSYSENYGAHHGDYSCEACGFKTPIADDTLKSIQSESPLKVKINDETYEVNLSGRFNAYNVLAAVSLANCLGIRPESVQAGLNTVKAPAGRMEKFKVQDKEILFNLAKNAVGVNETLNYVSKAHDKTLCFIFENKAHDGLDGSWIEEIDYKTLLSLNVQNILLAGSLKENVRSKIIAEYGNEISIECIENRADIVRTALKLPHSEIIIIPNYTPMAEIRQEIIKLTH